MNEFDELFNEPQIRQQQTRSNPIDDFSDSIEKQRKNGILLAVYIGISLLFSFVQGILLNASFPDPDAILDNIVEVDDLAISITDSGDETYPYTYQITGTLLNNSEIEIPQLYVQIEFFDEDDASIGVVTFQEENVPINGQYVLNESVDADTPFASYEAQYGIDETSSFYTLLSLLPVIIASFLFVLIDKEAFKDDAKRFKKQLSLHVGQIFTGFFMVYAALIVANLILEVLGVTGTSENEMMIQSLFNDDPTQLVMLFLLLTIFTPIVEEVIFRKVLYNFVEPRTNTLIAILSSGFIFGIMHVLAYGDYIQAIPYVLMGSVFGYIYYRSNKNIFVVISVHFLNNLLSFVLYVLMIFGLYSV